MKRPLRGIRIYLAVSLMRTGAAVGTRLNCPVSKQVAKVFHPLISGIQVSTGRADIVEMIFFPGAVNKFYRPFQDHAGDIHAGREPETAP